VANSITAGYLASSADIQLAVRQIDYT